MKKKKLWLVTGVAAAAVLAAGTVTFAYQSGSDSEEQTVYKEITVEKGNLTAGVTGQMNRAHQMTLEESIDRRTERSGNQDEYQYKEVNAPCLQALGKRKGFLILHLALSGKHLGVCDDGNNGSQ